MKEQIVEAVGIVYVILVLAMFAWLAFGVIPDGSF